MLRNIFLVTLIFISSQSMAAQYHEIFSCTESKAPTKSKHKQTMPAPVAPATIDNSRYKVVVEQLESPSRFIATIFEKSPGGGLTPLDAYLLTNKFGAYDKLQFEACTGNWGFAIIPEQNSNRRAGELEPKGWFAAIRFQNPKTNQDSEFPAYCRLNPIYIYN